MDNASRDSLYEMIADRATCRAYKKDPVPEDVLNRILTAGLQSPSGGGFQDISVIKITDPVMRAKLVEFSRGQKFLAAAPVSLVFCIDLHRTRQVTATEPAPFGVEREIKNLFMGITDASIAAQTMVLAAEAEGLGSCYNGNIINVMDQLSEMLKLPELVCPVIMLTLGYPLSARRRPSEKYPLSLLVHENTYTEHTDKEIYKAYRKHNRWAKFNASESNVEKCCETAEALHGKEYADRVKEDILEKGYLGPLQYWYGCYYDKEADFMTEDDYKQYMRKQGFTWL